MDWTRYVWRLLCLLACMTAVLVFTPVWECLPPVWQGVLLAPGCIVALLVCVASWAESESSRSGSMTGSTDGSNHERP